MYHALMVAEYVLDYYAAKDIPISNLKLQKILYFLQARFLVIFDQPCFFDSIEAWGFGPVVPNVYHRFMMFGAASIPEDFRSDIMYYPSASEIISTEHQKEICSVLDFIADYSATALTQLTLNQMPWKISYIRGESRAIIPNNVIKAYFSC